jgi:hypothetical protein
MTYSLNDNRISFRCRTSIPVRATYSFRQKKQRLSKRKRISLPSNMTRSSPTGTTHSHKRNRPNPKIAYSQTRSDFLPNPRPPRGNSDRSSRSKASEWFDMSLHRWQGQKRTARQLKYAVKIRQPLHARNNAQENLPTVISCNKILQCNGPLGEVTIEL